MNLLSRLKKVSDVYHTLRFKYVSSPTFGMRMWNHMQKEGLDLVDRTKMYSIITENSKGLMKHLTGYRFVKGSLTGFRANREYLPFPTLPIEKIVIFKDDGMFSLYHKKFEYVD